MYWPLTTEYEFALIFAGSTAMATIVVGALACSTHIDESNWKVRSVAMLMATAVVAYAWLAIPEFDRISQPLPPALDSIWFPLHAGTAALAYGAFALAGACALVWLLREEEQGAAGHLMDRSIATGYPLLTLSMLLGMVWAHAAWGRWWGWDLKEVWTLVTWLIFTLYAHVRHRRGWVGRRVAWVTLAGLGAVLFTFLGVGWLARAVGLESLHLF
jgi:ABC-type transport system involved in cytochrome c biogenesis permease subunit